MSHEKSLFEMSFFLAFFFYQLDILISFANRPYCKNEQKCMHENCLVLKYSEKLNVYCKDLSF